MHSFLKGRESISSTGSEGKADKSLLKTISPGTEGERQRIIPEGEGDMPKIELVSEEGNITRIIVTCSCGKCVELDCQY